MRRKPFEKKDKILFLLKTHFLFMTKITPEDLVRYLYNETSESKTAAIKIALQTDWNLRESYERLVSSKLDLKKIKLSSPRAESVSNILEYASKKRVPVT